VAAARYPSYDLDAAIEVARQIHERGTGDVASAKELAEFLGYKSIENGAFLNRVASARLFGLVEGPSPAIKVTARALDILAPDYPDSADRARLAAFDAVPLFNAFLEGYEGKELPDTQGLRNAVIRLGVGDKVAGFAVTKLLDSAEQARLFRVAGNRTKMIRPTLSGLSEKSKENGQKRDYGSNQEEYGGEHGLPRIAAAALELLPQDRDWDEAEFTEWLDFFERALRVHYRLPRQKGRSMQ
jgi:hypothetical protein